MTANRSVSTVLDVALALLLISASVTLMFVFLEEETRESVPVEADRTAETLAGVTTTVEYSLDETVEHDDANIFTEGDDHAFERSTHGTIPELLAEGAVGSVEFWGIEYTRESADLTQSVDGAVRNETTVMDHSVRLDAIWRPYQGASITGRTGAGQRVPPDADVHSVTMSVPSGFENITQEVSAAYSGDGDFNESAQVIAEAIIDGFLPSEKMQRALESSSFERELALYRYNRMSRIMDQIHNESWADERVYDENWDQAQYPFHPKNETMNREQVSAVWLNQYMVEQTLANRIAEDLQAAYGRNVTSQELATGVTIDTVQITVRTWGAS
jgi:hypothetical protein